MPFGASSWNVRSTGSGAAALAIVVAGWGFAVPALAAGDPTQPVVTVTGGPSCRPGGMVVQVTAGTAPYSVVLATTRTPGGEDRAELSPGQTVLLHSGDIDWGETIDARVELTARDGSAVSYVDELPDFTFTRPAQEDCAAITAPPGPATVPPSEPAPEQSTAVDLPSTAPAAPPATDAADVAVGGVVTVTASGFAAGEDVVLRLADGSELGTCVADSAGVASAQVRIPDGTAPGAATLEAVGATTATTVTVDLQLTAANSPVDASGAGRWVAAGVAAGLLAAAGGWLLRSRLRRRA